MIDDDRCCGSGACIINNEGFCWCGQKWDGKEMRFPSHQSTTSSEATDQSATSSKDCGYSAGQTI